MLARVVNTVVTMLGDKYGDEADMESTSFILQDADSYRGEQVGRDRE